MKRRRQREDERGFAMLVVFLMAAAIAISLYMQLPRVAFESQRQKEQTLVDRGEAYKRAIQLFVRKNKRWPASLEDLEKSTNGRYLRQRYKDPMTGQDEWRLVHISNGVLTDSINQKKDKEKKGPESNFIVAQNFISPTQNGPEGARTWDRRRPSDQAGAPGTGNAQQAPNPNPNDNSGNATLPPYTGSGPLLIPIPPGQTPPTSPVAMGAPSVPTAPNQNGVIGNAPSMANPNTGANHPVTPGVPMTGGVILGQPLPGQSPQQQQNQNSQQQQQSSSSFIGGGGSFIGGSSSPTPTTPTIPSGRGNPNPGGNFPVGINPMGPPQQSAGGFSAGGISSGFGSSSGSANNDALKAIQQQLTNPQANNGGIIAGGMIPGNGIVGVASKLEASSIMLRDEHSKYNEWEFIYDPTKEKVPGQAQASAAGQNNNNRTGTGTGNGTNTGTSNNNNTNSNGLFGGSSNSSNNSGGSSSFIGGPATPAPPTTPNRPTP